MQKPEIILTVGASGSGKTTWAEQFIIDNPNFINLNRDDMRTQHFCKSGDYSTYKFTKHKEQFITRAIESLAEVALLDGKGVVVSDTNLNEKTRNRWEGLAIREGVSLTYKAFDISLHVLLKRNFKRHDSRPVDVVKKQHRKMREFLGQPVYSFTEALDSGLPKAVVFDVDGTLAHTGGRRAPYEYDKAIGDSLDITVANLTDYYMNEGYKIIILTGRESDESGVSTVTIDWFDMMSIPFDAIWARAYKDHRCDAVIKEELFWEHVSKDYAVEVVYDDRDRVVDMWRSIGVKCFQVAEGAF